MGITYTANIIKYKLLGKNEYQPAISDDQKEESTGNQNVRYYNKKKILNLIDTERGLTDCHGKQGQVFLKSINVLGYPSRKKQIGRVKAMNFQGIKEIAFGNSREVPT